MTTTEQRTNHDSNDFGTLIEDARALIAATARSGRRQGRRRQAAPGQRSRGQQTPLREREVEDHRRRQGDRCDGAGASLPRDGRSPRYGHALRLPAEAAIGLRRLIWPWQARLNAAAVSQPCCGPSSSACYPSEATASSCWPSRSRRARAHSWGSFFLALIVIGFGVLGGAALTAAVAVLLWEKSHAGALIGVGMGYLIVAALMW